MALLPILSALAKDDLPASARREALRQLYDEVEGWGWRRLRARMPGVPAAVFEDATQKLALKACLGTTRFAGDTEAAAKAWAYAILRNHTLDWFRRERRLEALPEEPMPPPRPALDHQPAVDFGALLARVDAALPRLHRARDLETVRQNIHCYLEHRVLGRSLDEQLSRWAPAEEETEEATRRARDRVYQYRRRGRTAACRASLGLLESGEIGAEEALLLDRLLGCEPSNDVP